jgi:phosphodiesterase/alkaline phosphatase D-like protein
VQASERVHTAQSHLEGAARLAVSTQVGLCCLRTVSASPEADFTVKVLVTELQPATRYFYYFTAGKCGHHLRMRLI